MEHLVVVGGGLAGLRAVEAVRAQGWGGRVTLVAAEDQPPYDRPPLSKAYLAEGPLDAVTRFRSVAQLRDDLGVELLLGVRAAGVDPDRRVVEVAGGGEVAYDSLLVATGAEAIGIPGQDAVDGVTALRTEQDAARVRRALDDGARVVVVGAGFIGSEVASAAVRRGLSVTLVDAEPVPLTRSVGSEVGAICAGLHADAGVALRTGISVQGFESVSGRLTGVALSDGTTIAADLAVVGIGARPATRWLESAGVELQADGGVVCGPDLQTSVAGIWAAGDIALAPYELFDGDLMRIEHWTNAAEQGALAARNAVRGIGEVENVSGIPYFWSDWYGHRIQFVGSPRADEVRVVGEPGPGVVVLYRRGGRLIGALTIDRKGDIMKLRRRVAERGSWAEALAFADERVNGVAAAV